jgi:hypothetical protein
MRAWSIIASSIILSACAHTPPVSVSYPLAKSSLHTRVVRTVGCDASNTPVIANAVTTEVSHSADFTRMRKMDLSRVDGPLANSELKTQYYGDGRLKGVNVTTVGQGETIIKAAVDLAKLALEGPQRASIEDKCKELKKAFGDKPLTLTFDIQDPLQKPLHDLVPIEAEPASQSQYDKYKLIVGDLCLRFGTIFTRDRNKPVSYPGGGDYVTLEAAQPGLVEAAVTSGPSGNCTKGTLWSGTIQVAQLGTDYTIPIPRAALFGKQVFGASFDESGALTELSYNKDTGTAGMLNTLQYVGAALQTTDAERAAALKAEADVIAAQQRLVRCQTSPTTCQ